MWNHTVKCQRLVSVTYACILIIHFQTQRTCRCHPFARVLQRPSSAFQVVSVVARWGLSWVVQTSLLHLTAPARLVVSSASTLLVDARPYRSSLELAEERHGVQRICAARNMVLPSPRRRSCLGRSSEKMLLLSLLPPHRRALDDAMILNGNSCGVKGSDA